MPASATRQPVVVGVVDQQPPRVLEAARGLAADLGVPLVVVYVAPDPYLLGEYVDPMTGGIPIALVPSAEEAAKGPVAPPSLRQAVETALGDSDWTLRVVTGEPALALADVAEQVDARMIVVGTRDAGVLASIAEFLSGSVAVHLAHRQRRPVVVVPLPDRPGRRAPWDLAE